MKTIKVVITNGATIICNLAIVVTVVIVGDLGSYFGFVVEVFVNRQQAIGLTESFLTIVLLLSQVARCELVWQVGQTCGIV